VIGSILRATALSVVGLCLLIPYGTQAQCRPEPTTVVQGTAFLETSNQAAPGAKVTVQDEFLIVSAITDLEGKFRFSNLEPGSYTIEATYFGLHAEQKITVEAGAVVQVTLHLELTDLKAPPNF
jgi:Carboxypeptidase regulatory-like domain